MQKQHHYSAKTVWTGNKGRGTSSYRDYERSHLIHVRGKPAMECSSDAAFRGDKTKYAPEDLLVASLSPARSTAILLVVEAMVVLILF